MSLCLVRRMDALVGEAAFRGKARRITEHPWMAEGKGGFASDDSRGSCWLIINSAAHGTTWSIRAQAEWPWDYRDSSAKSA